MGWCRASEVESSREERALEDQLGVEGGCGREGAGGGGGDGDQQITQRL